MRSKSLLIYVSISNVRKNILYRLLENPMDLAGLRDSFSLTSADLIPRLKDLENKMLIYKKGGVYHLTLTGKIAAKALIQEERLSRVLEEYGEFFNDHDLSIFPEILLDYMGMLGECRLVQNRMNDINATYREIVEKLAGANSLMGISPIFDIHFPELIVSIARRSVPTSIILTRKIYEKVAEEYGEALREYLACENARLYVIDDARLALAVTDTFFSLSLYHKNGRFDSQTNLMSFDGSALKWGEELFKHYRSQSKEIKAP